MCGSSETWRIMPKTNVFMRVSTPQAVILESGTCTGSLTGVQSMETGMLVSGWFMSSLNVTTIQEVRCFHYIASRGWNREHLTRQESRMIDMVICNLRDVVVCLLGMTFHVAISLSQYKRGLLLS